jgi:hypothetical protein
MDAAFDRMEGSVTDERSALQSLRAIEEIKQLKARYFRLLDTKQWDEWGQVFATNSVMEVPEAQMVVTGRKEIVKSVSDSLTGARTVHQGHMAEVRLTGEGRASGVWAMFDYVEWPEQEGRRVGIQGYGHYLEEYLLEDGEWRISHLRLERLRVDQLGQVPGGPLPPG